MNHFILDRIYKKERISVARFNDGECAALLGDMNVVSRGKQDVTMHLKSRLKWALDYRDEGYYIGFPCPHCYPEYYEFIRYNLKGYNNQFLAVSTTNTNYIEFKRELLHLLQGDHVTVVGQRWDLNDLFNYGQFNEGGFKYWDFYQTAPRNADDYTEKYIIELAALRSDYYILTAGAASRYIAAKLHEFRLNALDLGTIFYVEQKGEPRINAHKRLTPYSNEGKYCGICNL